MLECFVDFKDAITKASNRFLGAPGNREGLPLMSFDCTDCMADEPWPFDSSMKSEKFNGPGFKYGVALAIHSDNICSGDGPHKASYYEGNVFKEGIGSRISNNEPVEVDAGIAGDD